MKIPSTQVEVPMQAPAGVPRGALALGVEYGSTLIARMREHADLSDEQQLPRGPARREAVYRDLAAVASRSQAAATQALEQLRGQGLVDSWESLCMPNALIVRAHEGKHQAVAEALRGVAEIENVTRNKLWRVPAEPSTPVDRTPGVVRGPEWGVEKVGAPKAWARGYDGTGVTVGIVDTGLDAQHPANRAAYRGTSPDGSQTHDYNWLDATARQPAPYDDGGHGTHVAGTVAGHDADHAPGVAPGARIIAAKAIVATGYNTTAATLRALQFMLAPTDLQGRNPDPRRGADVINNSWGNADREDTTFIETWNVLRAAGIEPVTSAGNNGPTGVVTPPGSYSQGISVAATTSSDEIAKFSSRGPSGFAPTAVIPTVAAPGQDVVSTVPGGGYEALSGTSMASPHVAGAVAVLLQAKPDATHEQIVNALAASATDVDAPGIDRRSGYGRINLEKAIDVLLSARS